MEPTNGTQGQRPVIQQPQDNPYKKAATVLSLCLNAAFVFFLWRFLSTVFAWTPQGLRYLPSTRGTSWLYLPFFILSAVGLFVSVWYAFLTRKTTGQESYLWLVLTFDFIQVCLSLAVIVFILNTLTCISPSFFGIIVCTR